MTRKNEESLSPFQRPARRPPKPHLATVSLALLGLLLVASAAQAGIVGSQRTVLENDIVHYTYDLVLGPGRFEAIRLHRVVRERHPRQPVATVDGVFMITGTQNTFEMIYLQPQISSAVPWDQSVAVFLAKNDIDVWGMDYAWALIPASTSNFGFMDGWGLQRDIDSVEAGLAAARSIRIATGQGNRRLHLLGFSYGVPIAYALAGQETLLPPGQRHVKGLVAVEFDLKLNSQARREAACTNAANIAARIAGGDFVNADGAGLKGLGTLAKFLPDDPSPVLPLLTNWQFALFVGALHDPWHFVGGEFDFTTLPIPIPLGLRYTNSALWIDVMRAAPPYMPLGANLDVAATRCDQVDVPFDDHLRAVRLPILAIGAAGGSAPFHYTASLTPSPDVSSFTVQLLPAAAVPFDFGHADLFTATDAEALVWQPLLDWLVAHRSSNPYLKQRRKSGKSRFSGASLRAGVADNPGARDLPRRKGTDLVRGLRRAPRQPAALPTDRRATRMERSGNR